MRRGGFYTLVGGYVVPVWERGLCGSVLSVRSPVSWAFASRSERDGSIEESLS
jgi:hypothetical protein